MLQRLKSSAWIDQVDVQDTAVRAVMALVARLVSENFGICNRSHDFLDNAANTRHWPSQQANHPILFAILLIAKSACADCGKAIFNTKKALC